MTGKEPRYAQKRKHPVEQKEPALNPQKKRPNLICQACRCRSNTAPWAATLPSKRSDCEPLPTGGACKECAEIHTSAFPYLQWSAFSQLMQTQEPGCREPRSNSSGNLNEFGVYSCSYLCPEKSRRGNLLVWHCGVFSCLPLQKRV